MRALRAGTNYAGESSKVQQAAAALDVHEEECNQHCVAGRDSKGDDEIKRAKIKSRQSAATKDPVGHTPAATVNPT
jgi:hypothetical protein